VELKDQGIYKLPDGREFVVRTGSHGGYILHDLRLGVSYAPVYLIDGSGQFLSWGKPTRWSLADLSDTGRKAVPEIERVRLL
jgi:hypothetical protein